MVSCFPTANLSWSKNNIGSFNLGYSIGMGRPNLWELNPFRYYSTTDEYSGGNPELKPTIYNNAEINYYGLGDFTLCYIHLLHLMQSPTFAALIRMGL